LIFFPTSRAILDQTNGKRNEKTGEDNPRPFGLLHAIELGNQMAVIHSP
jgi:hypothetical protein